MAISTSGRRVGNLPADLTSFVGRRRDIAEVKRLLPTSRLITLTGMGGVGKTRLALRLAADLHRGFADGVWLVELAGLQDAPLVPQTVAAALGVQDRAASRPLETLSDFLAARQLLLVLDNCEHLVQACAVLANVLLRSCPDLRILATSRQPLGIAGEQVLAVPPLSVPGPEESPAVGGLAQYGAVSLFVERAAAVQSAFAIDSSNQSAVAQICRRLDGIPLAIELAVGRLRALSLDQLLGRLDDRYRLLTGGSRAALPRQQTLRALIDWSFELCSPSEQLLWARLSVFAEGFDLAGAEQVCSGGDVAADDVLDLLSVLVDKSIVVAQRQNGSVRYQLSETLREYGRDRLAGLDQAAVRVRHRDWCRDMVQRAEAGWFGPDQVELFARLRLEHGNLRAALSCCLIESGESDVGLAMASALRFYWLMTGMLDEGRHWLDGLLAVQGNSGPVRLKGLHVDAHLAIVLNDFPAAELLLSEAQTLASQLQDPSGSAYVTQVRGLAALFQGDPARAAVLLASAREEHRVIGDQAAAAYDQIQLALAAVLLGDDREALGLIEDSLNTTEGRGENWITSLALFALGVEACREGDHQRAVAAEQRSIRLRLPLYDRRNIGLNFEVLAWCAAAGGDGERAARLFGAAQAIQQSLGISLAALGHLALLHDQYEPAARRALGAAAFERARDRGLRLGFDEAVAYAVGEPSPPATAPVPESAGEGSLTRREREIAELIARGLSNKEIASTLVIALRTAEGHVEHILTKLGFTSRAQVAAWVAERRSFPRSG
jgi:predicted ATPase/DNA-binding CsgD family transcriptional regulator